MTIQATIEDKIQQGIHPAYLEIENESHRHNVPPGSESHFKVTVVADAFEGHKLLARHRMLNELLADELGGSVHALALHTLTPREWTDKGGAIPNSPPCLGGGRTN